MNRTGLSLYAHRRQGISSVEEKSPLRPRMCTVPLSSSMIETIVFMTEPVISIDTRLSDSDVVVSRLNETAWLEAAELSRNLNSSDSLSDSPQHGGASRGMEKRHD
jgi:hypothetical protein